MTERVLLALPLTVAALVGCQAPQGAGRGESAIGAVLAAHHFAPPKVVNGNRGVIWAVASRPQSDSALQTACVRLSPDGQAKVEITGYQYVGTDWAIVGPLFEAGRSREEAARIEREINRGLKAQ